MKILLLLTSIFIISACGNDSKFSAPTNERCKESNLKLSTYEPKEKIDLKVPNDPSKSTLDSAQDGRYILTSAFIHFHDKNLASPSGGFLQYMVSYITKPKSDADKDQNQQQYSPFVQCISGLQGDLNGKLSLTAEFPLELEITSDGFFIEPKTLKKVDVSYNTDRSTSITAQDVTTKSTDSIDKINEIGEERTTELFQTKGKNVYQLQSRVTIDNQIVTVIGNYKRCVPPTEVDDYATKTPKQKDALQEAFDTCTTQALTTTNKN